MIVQNENGRFRLKKEFSELDSRLLDRFVRVSEPPPFGLTFDDSEFREDLSAIIAQFRPDLVIIDPWNAAARDEKARNYQDTSNLIRQVVPAGDDGPAIGIVAHTRKPQSDERVARDILRVKIEEKGTSRRTAYRRIDEAEQTGLIKFCKGKNVYVVS